MVANQQATDIASACRDLNVDQHLFYRWKCLLEGDGKAQGETSGSASDNRGTSDSTNTTVVSVAPVSSLKNVL